MESRPWRRKSVPPMPALIPISALRSGGKSPTTCVSNNHSDNNNGPDFSNQKVDCGLCDRSKLLESNDCDNVSEVDPEQESEKHLNNNSSGDESESERCSREEYEQIERRSSIDCVSASVSRDSQAPCAIIPSRRTSLPLALRPARTERHRKSERRRRVHRSSLHHHRRKSTNITQPKEDTEEETNNQHHQSSSTTSEPKQHRVNPIFVWVRQEDTRIVDVKCEDYDKRNRILLTKTAHGWRAIPRTETLTGTLEEKPVKTPPTTHHKHERSKSGPGRPPKNKKRSKRRESAEKHNSEHTESESHLTEPEVVSIENPAPESPWSRNEQDIESHLPSHTITIPKRHRSGRSQCEEVPQDGCSRSRSPSSNRVAEMPNVTEMVSSDNSVNTSITHARTPTPTESALETLLAAAEIAFNNQIIEQNKRNPDLSNNQSELTNNEPFESDLCTNEGADKHKLVSQGSESNNGDDINNDCDYNELEEDENQFAEVLDKLEQSLQSPEEIQSQNEMMENENQQMESSTQQLDLDQIEDEICPETPEEYQGQIDDDLQEDLQTLQEQQEQMVEMIPEPEMEIIDPNKDLDEISDGIVEENVEEMDQNCDEIEIAQNDICEVDEVEPITDITLSEITTDDDLQPTDLSIHSSKKVEEVMETIPSTILEPILDDMQLQPTDLSIKKHSALTIEPICRPPSQNSETIQSPQPSGIPAVPPSPDILPGKDKDILSKNSTKSSVFLESLLSTSPKIVTLNSEITITRNQKEPLDLGKGRKSASPTVTCSEEVKNHGEPTPKRLKVEDITLKNLLHAEAKKPEVTIKAIPMEKVKPPVVVMKDQSSRLLELLTSDNVPDPMTQLKQLLADPHINIPDPMLVPKDRLSHILAAPAKEIPRLLVTRPELRLPEALSHPSLMNDPDILVITMDQLHTILEKHHQPIALDESKRGEKVQEQKEVKVPTSVSGNNNCEKVIQKSVPGPQGVQPQQNVQSAPPQKSNPKSKSQQQQQQQQVTHQAIANDYHRYIQNLQHQQQLMLQEAQMKHNFNQSQMMRKPGLANDIDAATAASFNQMMWLPYLSQLEQAAQVTGNNTEFLKMLNAVFPNGTYPVPPDLVPPMFGGRYMPNNLPLPQPMDYNLEMSMWQEAMLRNKLPPENMIPKQPSNPYRESLERKNHSIASSGNSNKNKFLSGGGPSLNGHSNGTPYPNGYGNSLLNAQQKSQMRSSQTTGFSSARTNPIMAEQQLMGMKNPFFSRPNMQVPNNNLRPNIQVPSYNNEKHHSLEKTQKVQAKDPLVDKFNLSQLSLKNNPFFTPKEKTKPHHNFLHDISLTKVPEPFKPMDLSNSQPKLKVRTNLMAGGFSFGREEAEVGSTTEDAMQMSLHEANQNHHVWHPLFGK